MSNVGPIDVRLVRPEYAATHVVPMLDAQPGGTRAQGPLATREFDPAAYDEQGSGVFAYELHRGDHRHRGLVVAVSPAAFRDRQVRGHEAVQADRVEALVRRFRHGSPRSELVALLHRPGPAYDRALGVDGEVLLDVTGPDGWQHRVWRLPDAEATEVCAELGGATHYVADGHHRVAAGLRSWEQAGEPDDVALMCVAYPMDGLRLLAFHRRVPGPADTASLLDLLDRDLTLTPSDAPPEGLGVYAEGHWYALADSHDRPPGAAGLDVVALDDRVLRPWLGVPPDEPLGDRVEVTPALEPLAELTATCDADGGVLFALPPVTLAQLTEVADRGEVMPAKTTYFDPKPYAGIFLH